MLYEQHPELCDQLEWLYQQEISGNEFQQLNHDILAGFGIDKFGVRAKLLAFQQPAYLDTTYLSKDTMMQVCRVRIILLQI